jgi:hypothetical protein
LIIAGKRVFSNLLTVAPAYLPQRRQPGKFSFPQFLYVRLGNFQPGVDDVHVFFWCGHATLDFLLEVVKDKHRLGKLDGVNWRRCLSASTGVVMVGVR